MLAKITSKNQITLPKTVLDQCAPAEYYDVTVDAGRVVLTPVQVHSADAVRRKLDALGITEQDIADAVKWARSRYRSASTTAN